MLEEVVPSPDESIVGQVRGLQGVISSLKDTRKVFVPPNTKIHIRWLLCKQNTPIKHESTRAPSKNARRTHQAKTHHHENTSRHENHNFLSHKHSRHFHIIT